MSVRMPFHFGPAIRPKSHANPLGPGNPLFHRSFVRGGTVAPRFGADETGSVGMSPMAAEESACKATPGAVWTGTSCIWPEATVPPTATPAVSSSTPWLLIGGLGLLLFLR
jgi:hypothetical protein